MVDSKPASKWAILVETFESIPAGDIVTFQFARRADCYSERTGRYRRSLSGTYMHVDGARIFNEDLPDRDPFNEVSVTDIANVISSRPDLYKVAMIEGC